MTSILPTPTVRCGPRIGVGAGVAALACAGARSGEAAARTAVSAASNLPAPRIDLVRCMPEPPVRMRGYLQRAEYSIASSLGVGLAAASVQLCSEFLRLW